MADRMAEQDRDGSFRWDSKQKRFLKRTVKSWARVIAFYICFYTGLTVLSAVCLFSFLEIMNEETPYLQLEKSLIGTNPGMGYRPMGIFVENMIAYNANINESVSVWTKDIDDFLEPYKNKNNTNQVECDFQSLPPPGKVCQFKLDALGPSCTHNNAYGFQTRTPCFFVKLNKIFGWIPKSYEDSSELPLEMPSNLKQKISNTSGKQKMVWVSCEGDSKTDKKNMGDIQYWPYQGFPIYYYPYKNTKNYLSPLVAVQLKNPTRGVMINIECRAWAQNIHYRRKHREREGGTWLQMIIY